MDQAAAHSAPFLRQVGNTPLWGHYQQLPYQPGVFFTPFQPMYYGGYSFPGMLNGVSAVNSLLPAQVSEMNASPTTSQSRSSHSDDSFYMDARASKPHGQLLHDQGQLVQHDTNRAARTFHVSQALDRKQYARRVAADKNLRPMPDEVQGPFVHDKPVRIYLNVGKNLGKKMLEMNAAELEIVFYRKHPKNESQSNLSPKVHIIDKLNNTCKLYAVHAIEEGEHWENVYDERSPGDQLPGIAQLDCPHDDCTVKCVTTTLFYPLKYRIVGEGCKVGKQHQVG